MVSRLEWIVFGAGVAALLSGCSGSGSGGATQSLNVVGQVSLVDAQSTGSLVVSDGALAVTYAEDPVDFWVHDDSMSALDTVNMILCSLDQTSYDDKSVLNAGPYLALVNCEQRGGAQTGAGRGQAVEYQRWVVDSTRANDSAPQIVKFWIEDKTNSGVGSGSPAIIYGKLTITESPSTSFPYGRFVLHFKQLLSSQAHDDAGIVFSGHLQTVARDDGQVEFEFYNAQGDITAPQGVGEQAFLQRARLVGAAGGTAGRAFSEESSAYNPGTGTQTDGTQYYLQFNSNYMVRKKVSGTQAIEAFDRNDFNTYVYRYGLYDATTNERVDSLSGFGVETAAGEHGFAGFHGLWFADHVTITDGQTLVRRSRDGSADQNYTAVVVGGRLEKRSREATTFGNLTNEDFEMFDNTAGNEIRIRWNGTDLVKVAERDSQGTWNSVTPASITGGYSAGDWIQFWSPDRGDVQAVYPSGSLSDTTPAYLWTNSTVTADSTELANGDLTLYGYQSRLRANITSNQANFTNNETPYFPDASSVNDAKTYVFEKSSMLLKLSGAPVVLADGVSVTAGPGQWGFRCGPMLASTITSFDEFGDQTTTYDWTTGTNQWNQLRTIKDSNGAFVAFDAPLRLDYTHSEPANTAYHGKTFKLEWQGTDLHGVPFIEDTADNRWRPGFNIPSGTVVTSGETSYKIKQLEGEQEMKSVANANAVIASEGFDLDTTLAAPTNKFEDPAIGAMPDIDAAPLFIGGVAQ